MLQLHTTTMQCLPLWLSLATADQGVWFCFDEMQKPNYIKPVMATV